LVPVAGGNPLPDFPVFQQPSQPEALGSGTSGSAASISVYLKSLAQCAFNNSQKLFFHLLKILWESEAYRPSHPLIS
jgi:hypothetical protein